MPEVTLENIAEFQIKLLQWYAHNGRHHLPWRKNNLSAYDLIIAEILLQRTKAETVAQFYSSFIAAFPSWKSIANSDVTRIETYLRPVGLHRQRASRLRNLALEMVKRKGRLPKARTELESIPFMGQYMANAVELLIFKKPSYLLDVNMARLLERYYGERKLADIRYDPYLQALASQIINHESSRDLNWGILDFAASICKASQPLCEFCIFAYKCNYYSLLLDRNKIPT